MFRKNKDKINVDSFTSVGDSLRILYNEKLLPLESTYKFHELLFPKMDDADFTGPPMIMFVGQYSTGKTTFIRYLLGQDYPGCRIGPEPTTDQFIAITYGDTPRSIPGNAVVVDPKKPFRVLSKFGNAFLSRFTCAETNNELCKGLTIIDTPGILAGEKQTEKRGYPFVEVLQTIGERCDRIYLLFDAHKLDISDEFRQAIISLKDHDRKIRIILNKADRVDHQSLMRVYGAMMWSLGKIFQTPEVPRVYVGSFWEEPLLYDYFKKLFELEELDLMNDLANLPPSTIDRRLNHLIVRARLALTNGHIISELKSNMPGFFYKDKKKGELLESLDAIFNKIHISIGVSRGDFPAIPVYKERLQVLDFSKLPSHKQKLFDEVENLLTIDLPKLVSRVPKEESFQPDKKTLKGGIFTHMSISQSDEPTFNPFNANADSKLLLAGVNDDECVLDRKRDIYDEIFRSLVPVNGKIRGDVARPHLQQSKLSNLTLMKIWKLSDIDRDGCLDVEEFALCSYLVDLQLNGTEIPNVLPKQMIPLSKRALLNY